MRQRGRPSAFSLTVVPPDPDRPPPPPHLNVDEARAWLRFTGALPPTWFGPESWALLASLCSDTVTCEKVTVELARARKGSLRSDSKFKRFSALVRQKVQLSQVIAVASTKLRLTPSTRLRSAKAAALAESARLPKPWELSGFARDTDDNDGEPAGPPDWTAS
jgi:hypothetical protein